MTADLLERSVRGPEVPIARYALKGMGAAVIKLKFRADHKVLHGACDEHLARSGERTDTRSDVHADAGDIVSSPFDLTGVQASTHFDSE